jgi:ATP:corrinoid adenosyltransferase
LIRARSKHDPEFETGTLNRQPGTAPIWTPAHKTATWEVFGLSVRMVGHSKQVTYCVVFPVE